MLHPQAESFTVHHYLVPRAVLNVAGKPIGSEQFTSPICTREIFRCLGSLVCVLKLSLDFGHYSFKILCHASMKSGK